MLKIYDTSHVLRHITTVELDLKLEHELSNGDKTATFLLPLVSIAHKYIMEEGYIRTKYHEFVIKEISKNFNSFQVVATLNIETLEEKTFSEFKTETKTISEALSIAIEGTGWRLGYVEESIVKKRTLEGTKCTAWEIIKQAKSTYAVEIEFDSINKFINIHETIGSNRGSFIREDINLTNLSAQSDTYNYYTRIVAEGKDGLTFSSINGGKDYVENFQYSDKIKTYYWSDDRYTVRDSLLEDSIIKLESISKPTVSYSVDMINLGQDIQLGDTIELVSKTSNVKEKQRVVKLIEYPNQPILNYVELSNTTYSIEGLQGDFQDETIRRLGGAEQKITPTAIINTVTSSTQYKEDIGFKLEVFGHGLNSFTEFMPVEVKVNSEVVYRDATRGLHYLAFDRKTMELVHYGAYDIYANSDSIEELLAKIRSVNDTEDRLVILVGYDTLTNDGAELDGQLSFEIEKLGGVIPEGDFGYRQNYALIGTKEIGKGNGLQYYTKTSTHGDGGANIITKVHNGHIISLSNGTEFIYESMAQIKIEADNIKSTVQDNTGKLTQLTQTVDDFKFEVTTSGGANQLRNGGFKTGDFLNWHGIEHSAEGSNKSRDVVTSQNYVPSGKFCLVLRASNSTGEYGIQQDIQVKAHTYYTFSCLASQHRCDSVGVVIRHATSQWLYSESWQLPWATEDQTSDGYERKSFTFYSGDNTSIGVELAIFSSQNDGYFWITDVMLNEGKTPQIWQQHAEEVYTGITTINADGVGVKHSDGYRSKLSASSLEFRNSSDKKSLAVRKGGMEFTDTNNDEDVGFMKTSRKSDLGGYNGITLACSNVGDYLSFGYFEGSDLENWSVTPQMEILPRSIPDYHYGFKGIHFTDKARAGNGLEFYNSGSSYQHLIQGFSEGKLGVYGDNGVHLGYMDADKYMPVIKISEDPKQVDNYISWNFNGYTMRNMNTAYSIISPISRTYMETTSIQTEGKEARFIYENINTKDGKAVINIPTRYLDHLDSYTIVSLVKKGKGDIWISEEEATRFTIESEVDLIFNCEIRIKFNELQNIMAIKNIEPMEIPVSYESEEHKFVL